MGLEVAARVASAADLATLSELAAAGEADVRAARRGDLFVARNTRATAIESVLADERARSLVGSIDDVPVGYAIARLERGPDGDRPLCVVSDLYVLPDAREVGVGEALMDDIVAWARANRCVGVDAAVLPGDRETKNFFETFGLTARAIIVHRALDDEP